MNELLNVADKEEVKDIGRTDDDGMIKSERISLPIKKTEPEIDLTSKERPDDSAGKVNESREIDLQVSNKGFDQGTILELNDKK